MDWILLIGYPHYTCPDDSHVKWYIRHNLNKNKTGVCFGAWGQNFDDNAIKHTGKGKNSMQWYLESRFLIYILELYCLNRIGGNQYKNLTRDDLMFTFNRTLVVLISADKNLKVSGLLLGEELPQLTLLCFLRCSIFRQQQLKRCNDTCTGGPEFWWELSLLVTEWKLIHPVLCFDSTNNWWKLETIWARENI